MWLIRGLGHQLGWPTAGTDAGASVELMAPMSLLTATKTKK